MKVRTQLSLLARCSNGVNKTTRLHYITYIRCWDLNI